MEMAGYYDEGGGEALNILGRKTRKTSTRLGGVGRKEGSSRLQ